MMEEELREFLKSRNVPDETIAAMDNDKVSMVLILLES